LQRQDQEETGDERPVIGAVVSGERQEFTQRCEGAEREEENDARLARDERKRETDHHDPPGVGPCNQVLDHRVLASGR